MPIFWGIHAKPPKIWKIVLGLLPFIILVSVYLTASHVRLERNSDDKLLPSIGKMIQAVDGLAFTKDKRKGEYLMLRDTLSSLKRLIIGVLAAAVVGLFLGMNLGVFPGFNALLMPFVTFISIIPSLSLLPILFISFGIDEMGKVILIFWGTFILITRDMYLATKAIHEEQIIKALTLGASQFSIVYKIVLPQIMPRLIETIRLCLGGGWLFLIASEAIAATDGLGYRIFLVRRYMAMDIIIPYVLWITFLGYMMDLILRLIIKWRYSWYVEMRKGG